MPRKGAKLSPEAAAKQTAAVRRWHLENYENMSVCLRKGKRDAYRRLADLRGSSVSKLIQDFLDAECEKEGISLP